MNATLPNKELAGLQRRFKAGYTVEPSGSGHFVVLDPEGNKVMRPSGQPLTISSSPREGTRATKHAERELREAGVLRETPTKAKVPKVRDEATQARRSAATQAAATTQKQRAAEANQLRERLERVLATVGGFDAYGNLGDIAEIGAMLAREKGDAAFTPDLTNHSIRRVRTGTPIEERARVVWLEFAERLEQADTTSKEYFNLVRKAKGIPDPDQLLPTQLQMPSGEWPFATQLIPLDRMFVDHSYQRPAQWPFVRDKSTRFDPTLVGTIDVSDRGGRFAIMDGQQRFQMMRMVGKTAAWASVYVGLDLETESWFFIHKNKDRKNILPMHLFKAKITAGDPDATEIGKLVSRRGYALSIAAAGNVNDERNIASVSALEHTYELGTLDRTLQLLSKTTKGLRQGNSAQMIAGVGFFYATFPDVDEETLERTLTSRTPEWFIAKAAEAGAGGANTRAKSMRLALLGEYNKLAGRGKGLKLT